MKEIYEIC